jgi:hypothetical protein
LIKFIKFIIAIIIHTKMSEMKQKESSVTTGSANNTTPSTAPQMALKAPKVKK